MQGILLTNISDHLPVFTVQRNMTEDKQQYKKSG